MKSIDHYNLKQTIKDSGMRNTRGKAAVLKVLQNASSPLSAGQIQKKLGRGAPDPATIYRTLETLKRAKIVRAVNFESAENFWEMASHHHHAICESCGKVADISKCNLEPLEIQIKKVSGFAKINRHSLEFFGLCRKCA